MSLRDAQGVGRLPARGREDLHVVGTSRVFSNRQGGERGLAGS